MNVVEIEEAISLLAIEPFDAAEFPYGFLEAFRTFNVKFEKIKAATRKYIK